MGWGAAGRGSPRRAPPAAAAAVAGPSVASRAARGRGGRGPGARGQGRRLRCPAAGSRCWAIAASSRRPDQRGAPRRPGCRGTQAAPAACTRPARARPAAATPGLRHPTPAPARGELRGGLPSGPGWRGVLWGRKGSDPVGSEDRTLGVGSQEAFREVRDLEHWRVRALGVWPCVLNGGPCWRRHGQGKEGRALWSVRWGARIVIGRVGRWRAPPVEVRPNGGAWEHGTCHVGCFGWGSFWEQQMPE